MPGGGLTHKSDIQALEREASPASNGESPERLAAKAKAAESATETAPKPAPENAAKTFPENDGRKVEHIETKKSDTGEEQQVKGCFITKMVDSPEYILVMN